MDAGFMCARAESRPAVPAMPAMPAVPALPAAPTPARCRQKTIHSRGIHIHWHRTRQERLQTVLVDARPVLVVLVVVALVLSVDSLKGGYRETETPRDTTTTRITSLAGRSNRGLYYELGGVG